jgi:hypothetical protein
MKGPGGAKGGPPPLPPTGAPSLPPKPVIVPGVKMKKLNWKKIPNNKVFEVRIPSPGCSSANSLSVDYFLTPS